MLPRNKILRDVHDVSRESRRGILVSRVFPTFSVLLSMMFFIILILRLSHLLDLSFLSLQFHRSGISSLSFHSPQDLKYFQECSTRNFLRTGLPFLKSAAPLSIQEFIDRRDRLAAALLLDHIDAFVVEPGYTFQYYANVSQKDWEVWEPEERPFLMIIKPEKEPKTGRIIAKTIFLVPSFEAERARLLMMPFPDEINMVTWKEHWDPYSTLFHSDVFGKAVVHNHPPPKLMVDEEMRDFIQRGLSQTGFDVVGLSRNVERIRQVKSPKEIGILRAVNTGTVEAVRQMRKCLYRGLTERDVQLTLDATLRVAGLEPFFDIVLFDENASNPHGGTNSSKQLEENTLVLIDVGAHLYGYSSDVCRTFFPPYVPKHAENLDYQSLSAIMQEKLKLSSLFNATKNCSNLMAEKTWSVVFEAQSQSLKAMKPGFTAASVDIAARKVIEEAGYGNAFTHRVGHGIGIKAHESPYLHKGNNNTTLCAGMVFTSEPGIYLVDKFGVRHEDVFAVREDSEPDILSGTRAQSPWDP